MTPSEQVKSYGLKSVSATARLAGINDDTLRKWHKSRPELFHVVCLGCVSIKSGATN